MLHLAGIAARLGNYETAAALLGINDRLLEINGESLFPFDRPTWDEATRASRAALGDALFEQLQAESHALSTSDWLALAAEVVEQTTLKSGVPVS